MSWESDPELSSLYRRSAREEPSLRLDHTIAAAARDEAACKDPAAKGRVIRRWQAPFALAAVLILVVSLHWLADPSDGEKAFSSGTRSQPLAQNRPIPPYRDASPSDVPAGRSGDLVERSQQSQPPSATTRQAPESVPAAESGDPPRARASERLKRAPAPVQPASPPAVSHEPTQRQRSEVGENSASYADSPGAPPPSAPARHRSSAASAELAAEAAQAKEGFRSGRATGEAGRGDTASKAPSAAAVDAVRAQRQSELQSIPPTASAQGGLNGVRKAEAERRADIAAGAADASPRSRPEQWLRDIEELYRQGRLAEAQEQLTAFRKRFPDHELPPTLRER
jgi:hypothetical protein